MAKQKKPVHRVQMTDGKRNIIRQLLEEYDIETAEDIQDALKDLLGGTIKEMMEAEMDDHQKSRRAKQPLEKRSAGTMYLRPPGYHVGPMIKACGLIGFAIGDAEVSTKHADFVVNNGNASCEDVLAVLHEVQRRVKEQFGVHIPLDVRMLGEGLEQER